MPVSLGETLIQAIKQISIGYWLKISLFLVQEINRGYALECGENNSANKVNTFQLDVNVAASENSLGNLTRIGFN